MSSEASSGPHPSDVIALQRRPRTAVVDVLGRPPPALRGVLHQYAFVAAVAAGVVLVARADSARGRIAMCVYAASLAACLGFSAVYHRGRWSVGTRCWLVRIDRVLIFVLIAGTYTPLGVLVLDGPLAVLCLFIVWGGAAAGSLISVAWSQPPAWAEVPPYLVVASTVLIVLPQTIAGIGWAGLTVLGLGGLCYTSGAVVYGLERPDPVPGVFGYHEVFHALVIAGAAAHMVAVFVWMLPHAR